MTKSTDILVQRETTSKDLLSLEELVSLDVVSLFTKKPVDLALEIAKTRLREDVSLEKRTSFPFDFVIDLLSFCLNTTYFVYDCAYYQRLFRSDMGSSVSAVISNLVMQDVEE